MLRIQRGGLYSAGREIIHREIKELTEKGERTLLIVPEQQTVLAESVMSEILPPSAALISEVTNFTRLANTTFRTLGGLSGEYCDKAKKALIMWRTLTELSPLLSLTKNHREINSGMVDSSLRAVAQMQMLDITPAELSEFAEFEPLKENKRLINKLSDLSKIYSLYKALLTERYADTGDDADAMVKKLSEHPDFLSDAKIFIEGFTSFTEPQYKLIGLLSNRCPVTVSLNLPPEGNGGFEYTEIKGCEERLLHVARQNGVDVKLEKIDIPRHSYNEDLARICGLLWSKNRIFEKISLQKKDVLRIFEAITPFEESDFICADIKRRVMDGASYSDIAVICRDTEKHAGILDVAFGRCGIPAFTSRRRDLTDFEAIKLIYAAYSAIAGFSREDVIAYAKCPLCGISREECDELESYINKWQINGARFTDTEIWNMNPLGYTTQRFDGKSEKLLRIDSIRRKVIDPLIKLSEATKEAKTVGEQAHVLLDFLLSSEIEEKLLSRADTLDSFGEVELANETRSLWKIIVKALDALYEISADMPSDTDAFLSQLKAAFSATDLAMIPAYVDRVTVGGADMLRLYEKKHVYIMGVNAGEFPGTVADDAYFSEKDKEILSKAGLPISPDLEIKNARELYFFSRAFSYASESVTLTYSSCTAKFKSAERSEIIKTVGEITGGEVKPVRISALSPMEKMYCPESALSDSETPEEYSSAVSRALRESGYSHKVGISEGDISNSDASLSHSVLEPLCSNPLSLTQTKIDKYVSCPFGHFCKYTLSLSEDSRAEFDAANIGSFIHALLENFFRTLTRSEKCAGELTETERRELTLRSAREYVEELGEDVINMRASTKIKVERLCRAALPVVNGLCEEFSESLFEPRFFELALSRDNDNSPSPITLKSSGGDIVIYGVIDRVDTYKKGDDVYVRVVDYKTGHKDFSPDDMSEGANLQMFLYLKSIIDSEKEKFKATAGAEHGGRLIPAGVIYVKTAVGDVKIDTPDDKIAEEAVKAAQGREGMVLDDPEVISAMKLKYTPVYTPSKPDTVTEAKRKYLFDEKSFSNIMETVEESVVKVADGIRQGKIEAHPKQNGKRLPCEFCEFKPICRSVAKK